GHRAAPGGNGRRLLLGVVEPRLPAEVPDRRPRPLAVRHRVPLTRRGPGPGVVHTGGGRLAVRAQPLVLHQRRFGARRGVQPDGAGAVRATAGTRLLAVDVLGAVLGVGRQDHDQPAVLLALL